MDKKDDIKNIDYYRERLKNDNTNGFLWMDYADFLDENSGEPHEIIAAYRKAQELLPGKDLRLRLGVALSKAGQSVEAIKIMNESLTESPRAYGYCMLSSVYINCDQNDNAISSCNTAIALDPDYEEAYFLLGEALIDKSSQESIKYYRKAIQLDPDYQLAWQALGFKLIAKDVTIVEGISALRKAIELNPDDPWSQIYIANALWRTGNIEEADMWYKSAISISPESSDFRKWYDEFLEREKFDQ
jgi:tetratricopeptide (TPR) repeat protein